MSNAGVTRPASRVARTIGVFKWILIFFTVLGGVITAVVIFSNDSLSNINWIGLGAVVGAILYALMIWVLFGWFEHTLRALAEIAANTANQDHSYQQVPQYQPPPAAY